MDLGTFIRERRQAAAVSLRSLARILGCDPAYLSRVEAGKAPPSDDLIPKLAQALDCEESELSLLTGRLPWGLRSAAEERPHGLAMALEDALARVNGQFSHGIASPRPEFGQPRAIDDNFPIEAISEIAEAESWRKEVYRPIYHMHKWWAQRLGTVFRAAIIGAAIPRDSSVMDHFYRPTKLEGLTVFDPFMGSGTTIGEAHKLGCAAIGRDINPVAYRAVKVALGEIDRQRLAQLFDQLSRSVAPKLQRLYRSVDRRGNPCDVLYYFWVKVLDCPKCQCPVELFPRFVFTRHADKTKNVPLHCLCPKCAHVFAINSDHKSVICTKCRHRFDPHEGWAKHTTAVCKSCAHEFPLAATARAAGGPPGHCLYAKLVLKDNGTKEYLAITDDDRAAYERASQHLRSSGLPIPRVLISDGRNTRQILNYGYRFWHELFNDRQLLALATLSKGIAELPATGERDALALLFSGALEFNNMFTSYKGEGTGAVRHMFSHHILKPERMPIEANLWGTPQSSGAFSTLYRTRLLRAIDYREAPFEIAVEKNGRRPQGKKVFNLSRPIGTKVVSTYPKKGLPPGGVYLSCGNSASTDLPDGCVDLVVTDPPFFDNVHYSELADFFYVWQSSLFSQFPKGNRSTTRHMDEVQDTDATAFAEKLKAVFVECCRVVRDDGRLVFSYHHSREDGWIAIAQAVTGAGFSLIQCQPVKSEMSVAAPKSQAKEPIDLDVLLVCVKRSRDRRPTMMGPEALAVATTAASQRVSRFNRTGRRLSRNDVRVILLSQLLVGLSAGRDGDAISGELSRLLPGSKAAIEAIWEQQAVSDDGAGKRRAREAPSQLLLFGPGSSD